MRRGAVLPILLWLLLAGPAGETATVADMLGRPVAVPRGSLRLVSLAPSLTEMVFALGRGDWLVGVTEFCDYPPAARSKPRTILVHYGRWDCELAIQSKKRLNKHSRTDLSSAPGPCVAHCIL